jgi:phage terminase large subunit
MEVEIQRIPIFEKLYNVSEDTELIICIGGRGGAKTYEVSKAIAYNATINKKRVQVLRDEQAHIKESILNEILLRFDSANGDGAFDGLFDRQHNGIKNIETNEMQVFTKGFRASSNAQRANLKSVSNVDIAVIEEAEDIRDEDKFNTFADSIRNKGSYIIVILNTPDINHWIVKRYFTLIPTEHEGYYQLQPKQINGVEYILTNFEDNPFLEPKIVARYNDYGNSDSHLYNLHYYLTAIKGYSSTGLKGQIFKNYKIISQTEFNDIDATEVIGLDFGTSSPAGMVLCKMVKSNLYVHELNYVGMSIKEIAFKLAELNVGNTLIIADSAEPESVKQLARGIGDLMDSEELLKYPQAAKGFNIRGAVKGPGSIESGIQLLQSLIIHVTESSTNYINELLSYTYAVDKNNNPTDKPIDANNHLIDPTRYVGVLRGRLF